MDEGLYIGRDTLADDLQLGLSSDDLRRISPVDADAMFEGVSEFLRGLEGADVVDDVGDLPAEAASSAPLLIPGTRIFIRVGEATKDWVKLIVKAAAAFAIAGAADPASAFAGLSADMIVGALEKTVRLGEQDARAVRAVAELSEAKRKKYPSPAAIARVTQESKREVEQRLEGLEEKRVVEKVDGGWRVRF